MNANDDARAERKATLLLDAYYTIGRLHLFCEDYALHGWEPVPHLILADGCSAAPDSDLGARLLALNARHFLPRFARAANDWPGTGRWVGVSCAVPPGRLGIWGWTAACSTPRC